MEILVLFWIIVSALLGALIIPPRQISLKMFFSWILFPVLIIILQLIPQIILWGVYLIAGISAILSSFLPTSKTATILQLAENKVQPKEVGSVLVGTGTAIGVAEKITSHTSSSILEGIFTVESRKSGYEYANLRSTPSQQPNNIINKIYNGSSVNVISSQLISQSKWCYVEVLPTGQKGWIHFNMLQRSTN